MARSIVISTPRPAASFTPIFVAVDKGFLAEEGLDATMRYTQPLEALMRGEVDFMTGGAQSFVKGYDIKLVSGHSTAATPHVLMIKPQVERLERLSHVLIPGTSSDPGESMVEELRSLLAIKGVDLAESDINVHPVPGSHKEQMPLLKEGIGEAATLGAPWWFFKAREGWWKVALPPTPTGTLARSGMLVRGEMFRHEPEVVRGFVRACARAYQYCAENVEGTLDTMLKYSGVWGVENVDIARDAYAELAPFWNVEVDVAGMAQTLRQGYEKRGEAPKPLDAFVDLRFLEEALGR